MALRGKAAVVDDEILYPADDGVPMDDQTHTRNAASMTEALQAWLDARGQPAWIGSNSFIYYQHGDPRRNVGPDYFVVLGAQENEERDCWRVWNEGGLLPQVIVEFVSKRSSRKDRVTNFAIYRDVLKTHNYFICWNRSRRLEGYVLEGGEYVRLLPDANGRVACGALGLRLGFEGRVLRWYDAEGSPLPFDRERTTLEAHRANQETRRADEEARRANRAEQELARLCDLLASRGIDAQ